MTHSINTWSLPLDERWLENAKRYGLSERDFTKFFELIDVRVDANGETQESRTQRVQDFVQDRMRSQMLSHWEPEEKTKSPEDMLLELMSPRRDGSEKNWSSFLNLHFDLDTLQLLNGA